MRVLLIEDDEYIAKFLETVLIKENYAVDIAIDGELGWRLIETFSYDLILLDVMLPKVDGISLCRQVREHKYQTPILLLTARNSSDDRVIGLDAGADDYMVKPFELPELLARMRVLLRRSSSPVVPVLTWEQLQLDPTACQVTYDDRLLHLTPKEYRLLELFLRNPRYVFTRSRILEHLWGAEEAPGEDTITAHMKGLRQKLKQVGAPTDLIETVYGIGYRLKQSFASSVIELADAVITAPLNTAPLNTAPANTAPTQPSRTKASQPPLPSTRAELEQNWNKQEIRRALQAVWEKYEPQNRDRLQILEQTIAAMQADGMWDDLWQQAQYAAHKLAGALGIFERSQGSRLALQLEQFFSAKQMPSRQELESLTELTNELKAILLQPPVAAASSTLDANESVLSEDSAEDYPTCFSLFLILDNANAAEQLTQLAQEHALPVTLAADFPSAQMALAQTSARLSNSLCAQSVILNFSLNKFDESDLTLLKQTTHKIPFVFTIVFTDRTDLNLRIKLAHTGVDAVLPQLSPAQILNLLEKLRSSKPLPDKHILIVDDDPQILEAVQAILKPWKLKLTALERSQHFWETLQTCAPDLLILDVEMSDFNGIELCQAVRNTPAWNHLPIWILTAHTDAITACQAINAGANALLGKPIHKLELLRRIFGEFQRSQLNRSLL